MTEVPLSELSDTELDEFEAWARDIERKAEARCDSWGQSWASYALHLVALERKERKRDVR